jgi:predicted secreted protein
MDRRRRGPYDCAGNGQTDGIAVAARIHRTPVPKELAMHSYGPADNGKNVKIGVNQEFEIRLPESALAGYVWDRTSDEGPACTFLGDDGEASSNTYGGANQRVFRFRAAQPGACVVQLVHHRRWETAATAMSEHYTLNVTVE